MAGALQRLGAEERVLDLLDDEGDDGPEDPRTATQLRQALKHLVRIATRLASPDVADALESYRAWGAPELPEQARDVRAALAELDVLRARVRKMSRCHDILVEHGVQHVVAGIDRAEHELRDTLQRLEAARDAWYGGRSRKGTGELFRLVVGLRRAKLSDRNIGALLMVLRLSKVTDIDPAERRVNQIRTRSQRSPK